LPDLTEGHLARTLWRLALPTMASNFLFNAFGLVDMIFVGRLGPSAVAAVGLAQVTLGLVITLGMGVYVGSVAVVSRSFGEDNQPEAEHAAAQALLLAVLLGGGLAAVMYPLAPLAVRLLGAEPDVVEQGAVYLRISALGSTVIFVGIALYSVLRGAGDAITPLVANLIAVAINAVLDPIMIFGLFGFPRLEVAGSAIATVCARGTGTAILFYLLFLGRHPIHLKFRQMKPDFPLIWRLVRVGAFSSTEMLFRNISMMVIYRLVAGFGTEAVAANAIVVKLRSMVIVPGWGLGASAAALVGQNLGAGKPKRAERSGWLAVIYYTLIAAAAGVFLLILPRPIVAAFTSDPEVIRLGIIYARISAVGMMLIGMTVVLGRAMGGAGDTLAPMVVGVLAVVIRVAFAIVLSSLWNSVVGVWLGREAANLINSIVIGLWFSLGNWKKKVV